MSDELKAGLFTALVAIGLLIFSLGMLFLPTALMFKISITVFGIVFTTVVCILLKFIYDQSVQFFKHKRNGN